MPARGKQINVSRDLQTLVTPDYVFSEKVWEKNYGIVVHQHEGGGEPHYAHGEPTEMWGQGWVYGLIMGDLHYHHAEIKGR